jgi:hypothetical protein
VANGLLYLGCDPREPEAFAPGTATVPAAFCAETDQKRQHPAKASGAGGMHDCLRTTAAVIAAVTVKVTVAELFALQGLGA